MERRYSIDVLSDMARNVCINLPAAFVHDLAQAESLQRVLDVLASWLHQIFEADRASITIKAREGDQLKLYAIAGNQAIPMDFLLPIQGTLVGRAFATQQLILCEDTRQSEELDCKMLAEKGLGSCMDAPMVQGGVSVGTLNVAHSQPPGYTAEQALRLQSLANWMALNIRLHQQVEEMKILATTDELTGVSNRRTFIHEGRRKLDSFQAASAPFVVGVLDLDHFKLLNDSHGHDMGDLALQTATRTIRAQIREEDLLARIGGEEFAVILAACPQPEIRQIFERIREAIAQIRLPSASGEVQFTASIGVTQVLPTDGCLEEVVKRADKALYVAKGSGRNRIVFD